MYIYKNKAEVSTIKVVASNLFKTPTTNCVNRGISDNSWLITNPFSIVTKILSIKTQISITQYILFSNKFILRFVK